MRDLMIFLGSNTMAILVLTSKPSIKNKFIFYLVPIILMISAFLDYYYKAEWWIANGYNIYNFAVLWLASVITLVFRYLQVNLNKKDSSQSKDNEDV
ncbi:hypothetical protein [Veillonella sp.]|jgi:hypothetical protein|uniref:hypothetical protein n=1 Tax=Veillonella sp. TaxID=1926307 RepID=UPI002900E506|nr:hypothetical protein [Veillonella sp.]MDU1129290.1 hypothetical protein [Veillonella sp.]MDU2867903.1 hypothetical protein [Veillonella sp.]